MQNPLIVVIGLSGSGKDTFAQAAIDNGYDTVFKWVGGVKRAIENLYSLPPNALELEQYRNYLVPDKSYTFLELLIMLYEENVKDNPLALSMFKDAAEWRLKQLLKEGKGVIITDTRQPKEVSIINRLSKTYPVAFVNIEGRGVKRDSDLSLFSNIQSIDLVFATHWTLHNMGDLDTFKHQCAKMVREIESYHAQISRAS